MKLIPIFSGYSNQYISKAKPNGNTIMVDDEDYDYLIKLRWQLRKNGLNLYACRTEYINGKQKVFSMHREIMKCTMGDGKIIDHKDRNTFNNQKSNLRLATHSQNSANRRVRGKSKYMGVSLGIDKYISKTGKINTYPHYRAMINIGGKKKGLGYFKTEIEAAIAYDNAAKIVHGEFANLNFK